MILLLLAVDCVVVGLFAVTPLDASLQMRRQLLRDGSKTERHRRIHLSTRHSQAERIRGMQCELMHWQLLENHSRKSSVNTHTLQKK